MIRYFSTGYLSRYILILVLSVLLWIPEFIYPTDYKSLISFAFNYLEALTSYNNFTLTYAAFIATFVTGFLLNAYTIESRMSNKISTLVFAIYILITASQTGSYMNNPMIWVNFLMVFVWYNLMNIPNSKKGLALIFNASFLIGLSSLFYSQLILMEILVWVSIFIHRVVTVRKLMAVMVGAVTPYFLFLHGFYTNSLDEASYELFNSMSLDIGFVYPNTILNIIIFFVLSAIAIVSVLGLLGKLGEKNINLRRNLLITFVYLVVGLVIIILFKSVSEFYLLLSIPIAVLISYWVGNVVNKKWYDYSLLVVVILMFINNYYSLFSNLIENL